MYYIIHTVKTPFGGNNNFNKYIIIVRLTRFGVKIILSRNTLLHYLYYVYMYYYCCRRSEHSIDVHSLYITFIFVTHIYIYQSVTTKYATNYRHVLAI